MMEQISVDNSFQEITFFCNQKIKEYQETEGQQDPNNREKALGPKRSKICKEPLNWSSQKEQKSDGSIDGAVNPSVAGDYSELVNISEDDQNKNHLPTKTVKGSNKNKKHDTKKNIAKKNTKKNTKGTAGKTKFVEDIVKDSHVGHIIEDFVVNRVVGKNDGKSAATTDKSRGNKGKTPGFPPANAPSPAPSPASKAPAAGKGRMKDSATVKDSLEKVNNRAEYKKVLLDIKKKLEAEMNRNYLPPLHRSSRNK